MGLGTPHRSLEISRRNACTSPSTRRKEQRRPRESTRKPRSLGHEISAAGLDPKIHIDSGNKKDNSGRWATPALAVPAPKSTWTARPRGHPGHSSTRADAQCIEIWNLVFIQYNANADGTLHRCPPSTSTPAWASNASRASFNAPKISPTSATASFPITKRIFSGPFSTSSKNSAASDTLPHFRGARALPVQGSTRAPACCNRRPRRLLSLPPRAANTPRRNLPHFERPWAKYMVTFTTRERRQLAPAERDLVLKSVVYAHERRHSALRGMRDARPRPSSF